MTLRSNIELENAALYEIADEIEIIISEFKATKSKKTRKTLNEEYAILTGEYHKRVENKNIFHKSLESIK